MTEVMSKRRSTCLNVMRRTIQSSLYSPNCMVPSRMSSHWTRHLFTVRPCMNWTNQRRTTVMVTRVIKGTKVVWRRSMGKRRVQKRKRMGHGSSTYRPMSVAVGIAVYGIPCFARVDPVTQEAKEGTKRGNERSERREKKREEGIRTWRKKVVTTRKKRHTRRKDRIPFHTAKREPPSRRKGYPLPSHQWHEGMRIGRGM